MQSATYVRTTREVRVQFAMAIAINGDPSSVNSYDRTFIVRQRVLRCFISHAKVAVPI